MKFSCTSLAHFHITVSFLELFFRYIKTGSWVSLQMTGTGVLARTFNDHLGIHRKTLNTIPANLREELPKPKPLYPQLDIPPEEYPIINFDKEGFCLTEADNDAYNIVLLGPTGSGKSTLINNMFNFTVCRSAPTASSVTKEVKFLKGHFKFAEVYGHHIYQQDKCVNVIDTIGKCNCKLNW